VWAQNTTPESNMIFDRTGLRASSSVLSKIEQILEER
jgi:hypothetical protein